MEFINGDMNDLGIQKLKYIPILTFGQQHKPSYVQFFVEVHSFARNSVSE